MEFIDPVTPFEAPKVDLEAFRLDKNRESAQDANDTPMFATMSTVHNPSSDIRSFSSVSASSTAYTMASRKYIPPAERSATVTIDKSL